MNKDGILNGRLLDDTDFVSKKVKPAIIVDSNSVKGATLQKQPSFVLDVKVDDAAVAYKKVLDGAGASLHRDEVDKRIIGYLASLGKEGRIVKTEAEVGGQPNIAPARALPDTDGDGIPDAWEINHGLDPKNSKDANKVLKENGYTNLENYLNGLAAK